MPESAPARKHARRRRRRLGERFPRLRQAGLKLSALGLSALVRGWMSTLDYRVWYADPTVDPARDDFRRRGIYVFWHEYILFPLYLRGHCRLTMLLSRHRDADLLAVAAGYFGFDHVRGSTTRGGLQALGEMIRRSRSMNLTITPDGPRGPRRRLAPGCVYLASRTGMPLVAMGFGYQRPWRLNTWDRFAIPRPGSRARAVISPPIFIPPNLSREELEFYRQEVESVLNTLTEDAERWAASGRRRRGEKTLCRQRAGWPLRRRRQAA